MAAIAVDTHAIVWYLSLDPRLSARAAEALDMATLVGDAIHVPSICLVELTYLIEKGRVPAAARQRLINAIDDPATPCRLAPLDRRVADALENVSRSEVPDLPDRIVSATAIALGVPLVSRDGKIRASPIRTSDYCSHCFRRRKIAIASGSKLAQLKANAGRSPFVLLDPTMKLTFTTSPGHRHFAAGEKALLNYATRKPPPERSLRFAGSPPGKQTFDADVLV